MSTIFRKRQKTNFIIFILLFLSGQVFGQKKYKWPYFGEKVPPYIALTGGYEGLKTNNFQAGVAVNAFNLIVNPSVGAMAGGGLFYKQSTTTAKVYSYEAEIGFYGGLALGVNYNYNVTTSNRISGLKPFIGISVFNAQIFYGYSLYKSADDINNDLRHNRITIRYIIPILKLKKK